MMDGWGPVKWVTREELLEEYPMTTLVEEMAKAMSGLNPNMLEPGGYTETYWRGQAQAALDCVLKRLQPTPELCLVVSAAIDSIERSGREPMNNADFIIRALATHLDQERSRE
jgi:hypothetical protein